MGEGWGGIYHNNRQKISRESIPMAILVTDGVGEGNLGMGKGNLGFLNSPSPLGFSLLTPFTLPSIHLSMLSKHFRPHISACISVSFQTLKKTTAVVECLSTTSTRCSVTEITSLLQESHVSLWVLGQL